MDTENEYLFLDMADPNTVDQIGTEDQELDPTLAQNVGWGKTKTKIVYEEDHSLDIVHHEPNFSNGLIPSLNVERDLPSQLHKSKARHSTPFTSGADVSNASDELDAFFNRKIKKETECELDYEDIDMEISSETSEDSSSESDSDSDFIYDLDDEGSSEEGKKPSGKNYRKTTPLNSGKTVVTATMSPKLRRTSARVSQIKRRSSIDTETNRNRINVLPSTRKAGKSFESSSKTTPPKHVKNRGKEVKKIGNSSTQKAQPNIKPRPEKPRNSVKLTPELPFRCDTCGDRVRTATCLRRHTTADHKSFPCSFCSLLFSNTLDRTNHILQLHFYACHICGATFGQMAPLEEHHRLVRHGSGKQPQIHLIGCVPSKFEVRTLKKPIAKTRVDLDLEDTGNSTNSVAPFAAKTWSVLDETEANLILSEAGTAVALDEPAPCQILFPSIEALVQHVKEGNCACAKAFAGGADAPAS